MDENKIRVLCVDDHAIVREGIGLLIDRQPDMEIVGFAATVDEAIGHFISDNPDVTLMDLRLGLAGDGIVAIKRILALSPGARIVVLTMYEGDEDIYRAMSAGAVTYMLKDTLADDLIHVVRQVHRGEKPIGIDILQRLEMRAAYADLTRREICVIELVAKGMRNKEIAASLDISEGTVQVHMRNIFTKLDVRDRTGVISVAAKRGIIHLR